MEGQRTAQEIPAKKNLDAPLPKTEKIHSAKILPRAITALIVLSLISALATQHHVENNVELSPAGITSDVLGVPETLGKDINWLLYKTGIKKMPDNKDVMSNLLDHSEKKLQITPNNIIKNAGNLIDNAPSFNEKGEPLLILSNPGNNDLASITVIKQTLKDVGIYNPNPLDNPEVKWRFENVPANVPQPLPHDGYVFISHNPPNLNPNPDGTPSIIGYVEIWENPDGILDRIGISPEDTRIISLVELPETPRDNSQYKSGHYMKAGEYIFIPKVTLSVSYTKNNIVPLIITDPLTNQQGLPQR